MCRRTENLRVGIVPSGEDRRVLLVLDITVHNVHKGKLIHVSKNQGVFGWLRRTGDSNEA